MHLALTVLILCDTVHWHMTSSWLIQLENSPDDLLYLFQDHSFMLEASKHSSLSLSLCSCSSRFAIHASMYALIRHDLICFTTGSSGYEFSLLSFVCTENVARSVSLVTICTLHLSFTV